MNVVEQIVEEQVEKQARIFFNRVQSTTQVKVAGERFHCNIQTNCKINPTRDTNDNCSIFTNAYKEVRARRKCRMLTKGHVVEKL